MLMAMHFNQLTLTAFRTRIFLISLTMISRNKVTHPFDFYMKPVLLQLVRFRTTVLNGHGSLTTFDTTGFLVEIKITFQKYEPYPSRDNSVTSEKFDVENWN